MMLSKIIRGGGVKRTWELGGYVDSSHGTHVIPFTICPHYARNMIWHPVLFVAGRGNQNWFCSTYFFLSPL